MAHSTEQRVQCSLDYAIVDEVDSILIDEARTPANNIRPPLQKIQKCINKLKKFIPKTQ